MSRRGRGRRNHQGPFAGLRDARGIDGGGGGGGGGGGDDDGASLCALGIPAPLHPSALPASAVEEASLVPCGGEMVDRFDARLLLDDVAAWEGGERGGRRGTGGGGGGGAAFDAAGGVDAATLDAERYRDMLAEAEASGSDDGSGGGGGGPEGACATAVWIPRAAPLLCSPAAPPAAAVARDLVGRRPPLLNALQAGRSLRGREEDSAAATAPHRATPWPRTALQASSLPKAALRRLAPGRRVSSRTQRWPPTQAATPLSRPPPPLTHANALPPPCTGCLNESS